MDKIGYYIQILAGIVGMVIFVMLMVNSHEINSQNQYFLVVVGLLGTAGSFYLSSNGIKAVRRKDRHE